MSNILLVGSACAQVELLCSGLEAQLVTVPELPGMTTEQTPGTWPWADRLEAWRTDASDGPRHTQVVVMIWASELDPPTPLESLDDPAWFERCEAPFARWFTAMGVAVQRCAGRGSIVAVIERPSPLDCVGRAMETALADAVEAMVRSLARSEGRREVRVNAVTSPTRTAPDHLVEPAPSLPRFPGSIEFDVLGAVRLLLDDRAVGVTGSILDADGGRSWR